jgi:AcrR family transcriptional regulator
VTTTTFTTRVAELTAEVATHRHGRVPAELRRGHIVAVALELFADRGFQDTSMDDLAARAGVSKPVIYGLVGDKERLFRACVEAVTDELSSRIRAAMRAERHPEASLRAGSRAFYTFVAEAGPCWERLLTNEGGPVNTELMAARHRQADVVAELLGELLDTMGTPVDRAEVEAMAYAMNGACESLALWWRRHPDHSVDDLVALTRRFVTPTLFDGAAEPVDDRPLTGAEVAP